MCIRDRPEIAAAISAESILAENVESESLSAIEESQASGVNALSKQPEVAAANAIESGGGIFYPWIVGLFIFFRRKFLV